jgi:hypothetical protein
VPLGFRVVEVSEEELPHPKAAWLPAPEPKPRRKAEFAKASARSRASRRKTHAKKRR